MPTPTDKSQLNINISEEMRGLLETIKDAEGIPYAKQMELAFLRWAVEVKGLQAPKATKGARR